MNNTQQQKVARHECMPWNAAKFLDWIKSRGGIAIWKSIDLSDPGKSWSTPALSEDGAPTTKPTWQAESTPSRIITSADDVDVLVPSEVKRFRVALRMGAQGLKVKCTDASSAQIRSAVEKAGKGAWYEFDYERQEAVIFVAEKTVPLRQWAIEHNLEV
jgi:hypothetical protein